MQLSVFFRKATKNALRAWHWFWGIPMVLTGLLLHLITMMFHLTNYNSLLVIGWIMVMGGIAGYARKEKSSSRY